MVSCSHEMATVPEQILNCSMDSEEALHLFD